MKRNEPMKKAGILILGATLAAFAATDAAAQQVSPPAETAASRLAAMKPSREQVEFNLKSVERLLTTSSAARQIEASKAPEALSRRDKALDLRKQAQEALAAGDLEKSQALLTEARATFFDAVRFAAPEEVLAKKFEADYKARLESVKALLSAYQRVAQEKVENARNVRETVGQIEHLMGEAEKLAAIGKFHEGRAELDRAYLVTKAAVSSLRSGDTLVRSLNFANKEEEYHYELDRNNTHQMLIKVLVEDRKMSDPMLQGFIVKGNEIRAQADAAAAKGDYENAVKLLEQSTLEFVRAIRNAGIFIPG